MSTERNCGNCRNKESTFCGGLACASRAFVDWEAFSDAPDTDRASLDVVGRYVPLSVATEVPPAAAQEPAGGANASRKHSHYFKDVSGLTHIDVYRVLERFNVTDQAIGHAAKKLLCAGQRGAKDQAKDVQEAIDTLTRWQEMRAEDEGDK